MIPEFNHSFVLSPFVGERLKQAQGSPYPVTALELVRQQARYTLPNRMQAGGDSLSLDLDNETGN